MPPQSPHPAAVPYRRTFLGRHVAAELARTDDVLAVSRLARNWRDRFADPEGQARLAAVINLYDFFYRGAIDDRGRRVPLPDPDTRLYFPLPVRPRDNPSRRDADLTALLLRLHGADPRGVVLATGSGAGKTVAARKAFLDCFLPPLEPPDLVGPPRPPPLAGFLPCWLRLNVDTPLLRPQREEYSRREADAAEEYRRERRERARAPIVEQLLLAAAGLPFTAPIESWLAHGPPLLLFADLNAADAFTRSVVGMALADFQRKYAGRCRCVVAYRTTQPDDETVRSDQFATYDLDPIDKQQAVAYLSNVRDYEADAARRLGLPAPESDVAAECAKLAELIDLHADPQGRSLICTPLLMHLMSVLDPGRVRAIHSLADLYDQVVSAQFAADHEAYGIDPARKLPEHVGRAPKRGRAVRLRAEEGLRVAQARLALAMKARGGNTLSEAETRNVLEDPSLGRRSARPWTPADPDYAWHEAPYCTAAYSPDADVNAVLEFGMLRRHGDEVRFLHDSLIDFFAATAVGQAEGPSQRPAEDGWRDGWPAAATRRLHADPATWRNAARFLGGMLRPEQLRDALIPPMLTAEGKPGWPELIRQLLHGRRRLETAESVQVNVRRRPGQQEAPPPVPDDAVLAALSEALRLRAALLAEHPDGLFAWCFHFLRDHWGWIYPEGERERGLTATRGFAGTLENARATAGGSWLRAPADWPLAPSPHLQLLGHNGEVTALAVLEGGRLASAGDDGTVRVWDTDDGRLLRVLKGYTKTVNALAVLKGGRLASAGDDGTVRIWDVDGEAPLHVLEGHSGWVRALAALEDGRLASANGYNTVHVWDLDGGVPPRVLQGHMRWDPVMAALEDGLLVAYDDGMMRVWDADGGRLLRVLEGHTEAVNALAVLKDGRLVSAGSDDTLRVWDVDGGTLSRVLEGRSGHVFAMAVLEGGRLASASDDGKVRIWDVDGGAPPRVLEGHTDYVTALAVLEGGRLASASRDGTVRVWNVDILAPPRVLRGHKSWVTVLAVLEDGRLVSAGREDTIRVWDMGGATPHVPRGHGNGLLALAMLEDGRLVSAGSDDTLRVWDVDGGVPPRGLAGYLGALTALAVLEDGRLVSASSDDTLRVWNVDGRAPRELGKSTGRVLALAVLEDGRLAAAGRDGRVWVWGVDGGAPPRVLVQPKGVFLSLAVLEGGRLVSAGMNGTLHVWDADGGRLLRVLEGHRGWVSAMAVLEGGRLASASGDGKVRIWNVDGETPPRMLEGHSGWVRALAALEDGRLASAGTDRTIRIWDVNTEICLSTFLVNVPVVALAAYPSSQRLAVGLENGEVLVLDLIQPPAAPPRKRGRRKRP